MSSNLPLITLEIHIALDVSEAADAVTSSLVSFFDTLGIPALPSVTLTHSEIGPETQLFSLQVEGRICRYPDALLRDVYHYVSGTYLTSDLRATDLERLSSEQAVALVQLLSEHVLKIQPDVLLTQTTVRAYRAQLSADLPDESTLPGVDRLLPVLGSVLRMGISLADRAEMAPLLLHADQAQEDTRSGNAISEEIIAALRPAEVGIHLPPDYLNELTRSSANADHSVFADHRDELFWELGLRFPPFRLVPDASLRPNSFCFSINHLTTLPRRGLQHDQRLYEPKFSIDLSTPSSPDIRHLPIPGTEKKGEILEAVEPVEVRTQYENVITPIGLIAAELKHTLALYAGCFVDRRVASTYLEQLADPYPGLVEAVRASLPLPHITRVVRLLVAEGISIRNARAILQALLDFDFIVADATSIVLDQRLPAPAPPSPAWLNDPVNRVSFVRTMLKPAISHKYTRGYDTLLVYLLDEEVERMLTNEHMLDFATFRTRLNPDDVTRILTSVRLTIKSKTRPSTTSAIVLTTSSVRPVFHAIIATEYPHLPVVSFQELLPQVRIQPVSKIVLQ